MEVLLRNHAELVSLPVRGAWVEILPDGLEALRAPSLPVRGAWVEMASVMIWMFDGMVAPRAGSVG